MIVKQSSAKRHVCENSAPHVESCQFMLNWTVMGFGRSQNYSKMAEQPSCLVDKKNFEFIPQQNEDQIYIST